MQPSLGKSGPRGRSGRLATAIREAAWSAAACAIIATAVYARHGADIVAQGGIPLGRLLGIYAAGAVVAGTLWGLMRPLAANWIGAAVVSIPVAWPIAFSTMLLSRDGRLGDMDTVDFGLSFVLAAVLGPFGSTYARIRRRH